MTFIRKLAKAGLVFYFAYLCAAFVFLNTRVFHWIVQIDPRDAVIEIGSAWSFFPGYVMMRDFRIRIEDPNIICQIHIPAAAVHVRLRDLLKKQVHFRNVLAEGINVGIDLKTKYQKLQYGDRPDVLTKEQKRKIMWQLQFDQVRISSVAAMRVAQWSFHGQAWVEGGFFFWPMVETEIRPARMVVSSGDIFAYQVPFRAQPVVEGLSGTIFAQFIRFEPQNALDTQVFKFINARIGLAGRISDLQWMNRYFAQAPDTEISSQKGNLDLFLDLEEGNLLPGTRLFAHVPQMTLLKGALSTTASIQVENTIFPKQEPPEARLNLRLQDTTLRDTDSKKILAQMPRLDAIARSPDLSLTRLFSDRFLELSVPSMSLPRLSRLNPILSALTSKFGFLRGEMTASARAHAQDGFRPKARLIPGPGYARVSSPSFKARVLNGSVTGSLNLGASLSTVNLRQSRARIDWTHWRIDKMDWKFPTQAPVEDHWVRGWVGPTEIRFADGLEAQGTLSIKTKDTWPALKVFRKLNGLPPLSTLLLAKGPVLGSTSFIKTKRALGLREIQLEAGDIYAAGGFAWGPYANKGHGQFLVRYGALYLGINIGTKKPNFSLFPNERWFDQRL